MHPEPGEQTSAALSPREEWRLVCWMVHHPRALLEDTTTDQARGGGALRRCGSSGSTHGRRAPLAYAVGLAVGTLLMLLRRWW